jgi:hypothetical protein
MIRIDKDFSLFSYSVSELIKLNAKPSTVSFSLNRLLLSVWNTEVFPLFQRHRAFAKLFQKLFVMDIDSKNLAMYVQHIIDLSLNENNVHFLALSEVRLADPYQQLQEVAIKMIKD